jgi:hypothetical protein
MTLRRATEEDRDASSSSICEAAAEAAEAALILILERLSQG